MDVRSAADHATAHSTLRIGIRDLQRYRHLHSLMLFD